jgi:hypothetical protein
LQPWLNRVFHSLVRVHRSQELEMQACFVLSYLCVFARPGTVYSICFVIAFPRQGQGGCSTVGLVLSFSCSLQPQPGRPPELELELELIQTRMIQKPLLWIEVGKSVCVLVGIRELRLSLPARYDPQFPSLLDFLSGCLVRVLWIVGLRQILHGMLNRSRPIIELSSF